MCFTSAKAPAGGRQRSETARCEHHENYQRRYGRSAQARIHPLADQIALPIMPVKTADAGFRVAAARHTGSFVRGSFSNQPVNAAPFPVSATASSGLTDYFASTTATACTVSGLR